MFYKKQGIRNLVTDRSGRDASTSHKLGFRFRDVQGNAGHVKLCFPREKVRPWHPADEPQKPFEAQV